MEPSAELKDVYLRSYDAYTNGDLAVIEHGFSRRKEVVMIGTDPDEWVRGYDAIIEMFRRTLPAQQQMGLTLIPGEPEAYSEGTVGWVIDRPTFRTHDGFEVTCRATTLYHREDGAWKIIHNHYSIGVPNEEVDAFQTEAT
ncbi:MAG: nuclear transport factor 2 family protein [Chloroflexota bacterium]|nr:nuclear transport factor 2 family protein [Chloroflexota bacterium]